MKKIVAVKKLGSYVYINFSLTFDSFHSIHHFFQINFSIGYEKRGQLRHVINVMSSKKHIHRIYVDGKF